MFIENLILPGPVSVIIDRNMGFPGSSDGRESACNVGNLGAIPGSGRSPE